MLPRVGRGRVVLLVVLGCLFRGDVAADDPLAVHERVVLGLVLERVRIGISSISRDRRLDLFVFLGTLFLNDKSRFKKNKRDKKNTLTGSSESSAGDLRFWPF